MPTISPLTGNPASEPLFRQRVVNRNQRSSLARLLLAAITAAAALGLSQFVQAANRVWSGSNVSGNWSVGGAGGNWSSGGNPVAAPVAGDTLIFDTTNHLTDNNNDLTADQSFGGISFASTAGAFTLVGNEITLGGTITNSSANLQAINLNIILSANRTIAATAGDITIGGAISGTGFGVITSGTSHVVTLSGSNSYTGGTTIGAGNTVKIGSASALGAAGSSFTMINGATLQYAIDTAVNEYVMAVGAAAGGSNRTIILDRATAGVAVDRSLTSLAISGASSNGGEFITATEGANVTSGTSTLFIGSVTGPDTNNRTAHFAGNATYSIGAMTISAPSGTGTFAFDGTSAGNEVTGVISNNAAVAITAITVNSGAGTWKFSGTNSYTGATTISGGTLLISGTGSINGTSGIAVNGGTFRYDSSTGLSKNVTVAGGAFRYNSSSAYTGTLTFTSGTIGGTNFANKALSIGTNQTLSPANSTGTMSAGATTFANGGTYEFELNDAAGTAGSSSAGWDLLNASTLTFTATTGQFNLTLISLTSGQVAGLAQNFNAATSYKWLFADAGSTITSFSGSAFTINTTGFQNSISGTFSVVRGDASGIGGDDSQLYLVYTASAIPEPSTCALLAGVVLAGYTVTRRRRSPA